MKEANPVIWGACEAVFVTGLVAVSAAFGYRSPEFDGNLARADWRLLPLGRDLRPSVELVGQAAQLVTTFPLAARPVDRLGHRV